MATTPSEGNTLDLTGIPTTRCPCGSNVFKTLVSFDDEDKTIAWYTLQGYCYLCGTRVSFPEPPAENLAYR